MLFMNCTISLAIATTDRLDTNVNISIAVSVCYWLVAASIAELASGMPSASGGTFDNVLCLTIKCRASLISIQCTTGPLSQRESMVVHVVSSLAFGTVWPGSLVQLLCLLFWDSRLCPCML